MDRFSNGETISLIAELVTSGINSNINIWKKDGTHIVINQPCVEIIPSVFIYNCTLDDEDYYVYEMKAEHPTNGQKFYSRSGFMYGGYVYSLLEDEQFDVLAKQATSDDIKTDVGLIATDVGDIKTNVDEKISTRATPQDIKTFSVTRIVSSPRALELIAKSVSHYYRGQTANLVVFSTFAGSPTDVSMYATIYYPDNTVYKNEEEMTPLESTGLYTLSFVIPNDAPEGVYKVKYSATKNVQAEEYPDIFSEEEEPVNWTVISGIWSAADNILSQTETAAGNKVINWSDEASLDWENYTFETDLRDDTITDNIEMGVIIRSKASTLGYYLRYSRPLGTLSLLKNNSNTVNSKSYSLNRGQWYRFKIEVNNYTIKCYIDDVLEFEWIDLNGSTLMSGTVMIRGTYLFSAKNVLITIPEHEYQEFEVTDFQITENDISFIRKIEQGRWKINTNTKEMVFYDENDEQLMAFDLFDQYGNRTYANVFERMPK